MKKTIIIITLFLIFLPPLLHVALLLNGKYHSYGRTFQAYMDKIGWQLTFTEQNSDYTLKFTVKNIEKNQCDSFSLLTHNTFDDVISFVFVEGVDTVYIRNNPELRDLFPPEEQSKYPVSPEWFEVYDPIIGDIPSGFQSISFSDLNFFSYDRNKCTYVPKSNKIHLLTLSHNTGFGNTFDLFDFTSDDTLRVQLVRLE